MNRSVVVRILPFALFMGFIGLEELLRYLTTNQVITLDGPAIALLYPVKTLAVGATILYVVKEYGELSFQDLLNPRQTLTSILAGLLIFFLWIHMDWDFATLGQAGGFDPTRFETPTLLWSLTAFRFVGAVLVVPVMEELFWRSFLIRYIHDPNFSAVPLGLFTWPSFLITAILFGLEHNLVLAGVLAGILFNLLLYHTRSLAQCILSHAVANLALGIYVVKTHQWQFW